MLGSNVRLAPGVNWDNPTPAQVAVERVRRPIGLDPDLVLSLIDRARDKRGGKQMVLDALEAEVKHAAESAAAARNR